MLACLAPNGMNVFRGTSPVTCLLVGTIRGIAILDRSAKGDWSDSGIALEGHHISSTMIEPHRGMVFAAVHGGGVYRSDDNSSTWAEASTGIIIRHVYTLACTSSRNGSVLYAGTEPVGLFRSRDYGESWTELRSARDLPGRDKWNFPLPPHAAHVKTINIDPRDPNRLLIGVEQGGVYQSKDCGESWTEIDSYANEGDKVYKDIHQIARRPSRPDEIAMTSGMGLYYSKNNGGTWTHLTDREFRVGCPDKLIFLPGDESSLIICGAHRDPGSWIRQHTANPGVMISHDLGATWEDAGGGLPLDLKANIEALSISIQKDSYSLFAGTTDGDVYVKADVASGWTRIGQRVPPVSKVAHYRLLIPGAFPGGRPPGANDADRPQV